MFENVNVVEHVLQRKNIEFPYISEKYSRKFFEFLLKSNIITPIGKQARFSIFLTNKVLPNLETYKVLVNFSYLQLPLGFKQNSPIAVTWLSGDVFVADVSKKRIRFWM